MPPAGESPLAAPPVLLSGLVTDRFGEPAVGATIRLAGASGAFEAVAEAEEGGARYRLEVPGGAYRLEVHHESSTLGADLWLAPPRAELTLRLAAPVARAVPVPAPTVPLPSGSDDHDPRSLTDREVSTLDFTNERVRSSCRVVGAVTARMATTTGLRVCVAEREQAGIEVPVSLDADSINVIAVTLRYIPGGGMATAFLEWQRDGVWTGHRVAITKEITPGRETVFTYAAPVGAELEWRGRITALRFFPGQDELELQRLSFRQVSFAAALRARGDALDIVTIRGQRRPAVFCPSPGTVTRRLRVPEGGAQLRLGYALHPEAYGRPGQAVRFVAEVRGGEQAVVMDRVLQSCGVEGDRGWQDASADVSRWVGQRIELALRTEAVTPNAGPDRRYAFWGEPEIIPRARTDARPNVVVISLDSLRRDRVGCLSGRADLTPHLDLLAAGAARCSNAWATSRWTLGSHAAIVTGRHQLAFGDTTTRLRIPPEQPTLTDLFAGQGYACAGFVGGGFVEPPFGFGRGCRTYELAAADAVFARAADWIRAQATEPVCVFLHTFEIHDFFEDDPRVRELYFRRMETTPLPDHDQRLLAQCYESRVRRADARVGEFLAALRAGGAYDNTILVVFGDHGDGLGEHGHVGHSGTLTMWEETLAVPLLIKPAGPPPVRALIAEPVSLVDVLPTVLDLAGLPPLNRGDGQSLAGAMAGADLLLRPHFAELQGALVAVRDEGQKLVAPALSHPRPRGALWYCHDLRADPGETTNLTETNPEVTARLLALVREWAARHARGFRLWFRNGDRVAHRVTGTLSAAAGLQFVMVPPMGRADRVGLTPFDEPVPFRLSLEPGEERLVVFDARSDPTIALEVDGRPLDADAVRGPDGASLGAPPVMLGGEVSYDCLLAPAPPRAPRDDALTVTLWHQEPERCRRAAAAPAGDIPADVRERLAALGYL